MSDLRKFQPATLVRFQIRLEDYGPGVDEDVPSEQLPFDEQLKKLRQQASKLSEQAVNAFVQKDNAGALKAQKQLRSLRAQIKKLTSSAPSAKATAEGLGDAYSIQLLTSPLSYNVEVNTFKSPDTAEIKIPFRDLPLESQNVRSCLVEVFQGCVTPQDFGSPQTWKLPVDKSTILFRGFADTWGTDHDDQDAVVEIKGRSLEAILYDTKIDPLSSSFRVKKGGEPISDYVNRVLSLVPATSGRTGGDQMKAVFFLSKTSWEAGTTRQFEPRLDQKVLLRTLQTAQSRNQAAGKGAGGVLTDPNAGSGTPSGQAEGDGTPRMAPTQQNNDSNAWDLIVQACFAAHGCTPVYDPSMSLKDPDGNDLGDFILIRSPRTLYDRVNQGTQSVGGAPDDFSRELPDPNTTGAQLVKRDVRMMVWGRNIKKFSTNRKLGRIKTPTIILTSYNPDEAPSKKYLEVRFPTQKQANHMQHKGRGKQETVIRKTIYGIRDEKTLLGIAQSIYHQVSHNELSVTIETDDLSSYVDPSTPELPNNVPDLLSIRHGTPLRIAVAKQVAGSKGIVTTPLSDVFTRSGPSLRQFFFDQMQRFRPTLDPNEQLAAADQMVQRIQVANQSAKRTDLFYVRSVQHSWSSDDGWSAVIEAVNYLEARADPSNMGTVDKQIDAQRILQEQVTGPVTAAQIGRARARAALKK